MNGPASSVQGGDLLVTDFHPAVSAGSQCSFRHGTRTLTIELHVHPSNRSGRPPHATGSISWLSTRRSSTNRPVLPASQHALDLRATEGVAGGLRGAPSQAGRVAVSHPHVLLINPGVCSPSSTRLPLSVLNLAAVLEGQWKWRVIDGNVETDAAAAALSVLREIRTRSWACRRCRGRR